MRRFGWSLLSFIRRPRFEADLRDEFQDHLRVRIDDLIASGVPPSEAALQARREFGSVELLKDECRDSSGLAWIDSVIRNVRISTRMLRKSPAFTAATVLILALCIGANTAIFSVVDAALFRDLPYPEPHRLGLINRHIRSPQGEFDGSSQNGRTWEFLQTNAKSVDLALMAGTQGVNLALSNSQAVYVTQHRVSSGYFRVLGIAPMVGREFTPAEDRAGGPAVAVISESLWRTSFNSDPAIVGRTIRLRGEPHAVIGVLPASFTALPPADVWTPVRPSTTGEGSGNNYSIVARARSGFEIAQVNAELNNLGAALLASAPQKLPAGVSVQTEFAPAKRVQSNGFREPLWLLWTAAGLVLLIGCVNIAGLMLARNSSRQREIATRMALGGSRAAVAMQLLTESLLLAGTGGISGVLLAYVAIHAYGPTLTQAIGFAQVPQFDVRVGLAAVVVTLATTLFFGLYPAWNLSRLNVRGTLTAAGRTASPRGSIARQVLVGAEVAIAVVLLACAGLVLKTLSYLTHLEPGFDASNVMTASLSLQDARYGTTEEVNHLFDASLDAVRQTSSVESAGIALTLPYERALNDRTMIKDGPHASSELLTANMVYVTPGLFEALRMRPLAGRLFDQRDRRGAPPAIIVNEAFMKRYFHGDDPVGLHLRDGEIVGVVSDTQQKAGWDNFGPIGRVPTYYVPAAQSSTGLFRLVHAWFSPKWVVRMRGKQGDATRILQQAVSSVDPLLPFAAFQPMDQIRQSSLSLQRTESLLLGSLAFLALLLIVAGVYGLIAQTVSDQSREFGIRIALGCTPFRVIARTAQRGVLLALLGCVGGTLLALAGGKYIASILWGVRPNDPFVLMAVPSALLLVSFLASVLPSLRLARLELLKTLRSE